MAPLKCSSPSLRLQLPSPPSRLQLPSPPSRLRPPPDPPPPCTPLLVPLEAPSPPEPPDPPESPFHLVLRMLFDTSLISSQTISKSPDLESVLLNMDSVISVRVHVVLLVSVGDTGFASKRLLSPDLYQRFSNLCFSDVLISLVCYLGFSHGLSLRLALCAFYCSMQSSCCSMQLYLCGSSMLKIRDTSNIEVLIKGCLAILKIVNCALAAVSISGCISLFVVFNSQGFVSFSSSMVVKFRGLLYAISCLSMMSAPIFICCICFLLVSLAMMAMLSFSVNTFFIHGE
ncbi:hypothetical protein Bca4012_055537 [Brassica carinata]